MSRAGRSTPHSVAVFGLWVCLLACAAWAAVRTLGLESGSPSVQLIAYTPYVALITAAVLAVGLVLRRWFAAAIALLTVVAFAAAVLPRAVGDGQGAAEGGSKLTVMSANLLRGEADADELVELVDRNGADILSVQELTPEAAIRLREAGLHELLPNRVLNLRADTASAGIYARQPLQRLRRTSQGSSGVPSPQAALRLRGGEPVELVAVHLTAPTRPAQIERWRHGFRSLPLLDAQAPPRILVGDFNATLDHDELRALRDSGYVDAAAATGDGLVPTWRSGRLLLPPLTIDHVLVDPRVRVNAVAVNDIEGSDHRAVTVKLTIGPARPEP